ncbi:alpha-mannosidase [Aphanothece hegewaldii CCALA 016]|uniref:Alpha-mannosidase n=1 Tax=Aphanothece hegewaldii CCALA 016 TaxID=2107694 RepID=A0A2T1M204_9CHRO|nr:alpha-mannosidase [Aphanothece hegewaldii]PSF38742.1 alpha-mannosidase [Aphanothece hegewaldii CCALA 016]
MSNSEISQSILDTLDKLRQLVQVDVQENWYYLDQDLSIKDIKLEKAKPVQLNDKRYIIWSSGRQVQWLIQKIKFSSSLKEYPLIHLTARLVLTWWAEDAKIYINGKLVQEGDLFDSTTRRLLTTDVIPQREIIIALRLVSPGHDIGALMRSVLIFEKPDFIDPAFVADELTVLYNYLQAFEPEKLDILANTLNQISWNIVSDQEKFNQNLLEIREQLQPLASSIKKRQFHLLGHAHLDLAWLWPIQETWEVAQKTFNSVLKLQKYFSELKFGQSSPVLYEWIENNRFELFTQIQEAYKAKSWELLGGMWVEPEVNLISGESLIRQLLYGQNYFKEKFGTITKVAWLPDTFGFPWQLPQIFKQAGIEYFVTGKLHWNDTTKFPHGVFWWKSPDGTQLLSLMSPPNVAGVMDTNPIIMMNYAISWEQQTGLKDAFWLPGVGDHGGGPTRDMLEVQQRWQNSPFFPQISFTTAQEYLDNLPQENLPVWNDELYLEFHRGCYTTHGDQKYYNRYCEKLLYQAELWSSLASIHLELPYPKTALTDAWKKVLLNQFHDILPGTSIPKVFEDANREWCKVIETGEAILDISLQFIASRIILPIPPHSEAIPIIIFNSLNWTRSEVVSIIMNSLVNWDIYDVELNQVYSQITSENKLLFLAKDIPSVGYRLFWLSPTERVKPEIKTTSEFILENDYIKVIINHESGDLESIFDKVQQKEILNGAGNQLQAFQDKDQYWDAWNIAPNYQDFPLQPSKLKSIEYLDYGLIQSRIRVIRIIGNSEFIQDYILRINSSILQIKTTVNWQEENILVKVAFPLKLESDVVTYEIACGAIERLTCPQTEAEKAKWEVYGHRWIDLTDVNQNYGVSLLNDCKYGFDCQMNQIRLTLLRGTKWPDINADKRIHSFTYAIYPHSGNWQEAKTVHRGYELNIPLKVIFQKQFNNTCLSPVSSWLNIGSDSLILIALKQFENDVTKWIMRCYESEGKIAYLDIASEIGLTLSSPVNLLEEDIVLDELTVKPWQIVSYKIQK